MVVEIPPPTQLRSVSGGRDTRTDDEITEAVVSEAYAAHVAWRTQLPPHSQWILPFRRVEKVLGEWLGESTTAAGEHGTGAREELDVLADVHAAYVTWTRVLPPGSEWLLAMLEARCALADHLFRKAKAARGEERKLQAVGRGKRAER